MNRIRKDRPANKWSSLAGTLLLLFALAESGSGQVPSNTAPAPGSVVVLEKEGTVEISPDEGQRWFISRTNQSLSPGDRLRTLQNSRATLRLADLSLMRVDQLSEFQAPATKVSPIYKLWKGVIYFFHRDKPGNVRFDTSTSSAAIRGTEFNLQVTERGSTVLTMLQGEVDLSALGETIRLRSHEQGTVEPGQAPRKTPALETINIIQWCLYYPAALDSDELTLSEQERQILTDSLSAYRSGDLLDALAKYPVGREPASGAESVYLAALLLSVGQVEQAEENLKSVEAGNRDGRSTQLSLAMRKLISAVRGQIDRSTLNPELSTAFLAESYYEQSRGRLEEARQAARHAVEKSPGFGLAWARVGELEISFGRIKSSLEALAKGLQLAPHNAQALALKGFVLTAQNRITEALGYFELAIAMDGALGNAWLGRGLCKIRRGQAEAGREDLQMAATLEPQRGLLRSYLGKAFSQTGDSKRAADELLLARMIDPRDPTAWLYAALLKEQNNAINDAVRDIEKSQELGENRRIYRSRLLLDQDRAVRGANQANVYLDAGMMDVSVREAVRAVNSDYANYSAHLFLANSYNALRDPRQVNLRYETPWLSEYLIANLLAPVGAGTLSQTVSQQEYSKLFERDRLGFSSSTEYYSRGDWIQSAVQYGTSGNSSYAAEVTYRSEHGHRPNNDLEQFTASLKLKQQLTPQDSLYLQGIYYNSESGDVSQYYDERRAHPALRVKESQEPILLAGYHHEWAPGSHTLFLGGRFQDTLKVSDTNQTVFVRWTNASGAVVGLPYPTLPGASLNYWSEFEGYSAELQHLLQVEDHTLVVGARYQTGTFDTQSRLAPFTFSGFANSSLTNAQTGLIDGPAVSGSFKSDFQRVSFYGYDYWQALESVLLTAGISYDQLRYPVNFRYSPISDAQENTDRVSPKAGIIWTPVPSTAIRAAYARSLGGVAFDRSFQLEPSQVGGFNQTFRSLIPESVAGSIAGSRFETFGLGLDQKFGSRTYFGVQGELLRSQGIRTIGAVNRIDNAFQTSDLFSISSSPEHLDFDERNLIVALNQLVGSEWAFGARYRLSQAELNQRFQDLSPAIIPAARSEFTAILHQVNLFALYNHSSGFFSQFETIWSHQSNRGYSPEIPGDDFWQFNAFAGYRFPRRQAEVRVGLLNISDQNYRLNPLNLTTELSHERTLVVSLRFNF